MILADNRGMAATENGTAPDWNGLGVSECKWRSRRIAVRDAVLL